MRLATYNVEWFDGLFDDDGTLVDNDSWSARWNVTKHQRINALGTVFKAIDADGLMIIEAPDTSRKRDATRALKSFATRFGLRTNAALTGFANNTQQEIALLYDPKVMTAHHDPQEQADAPRFDTSFAIDLDVDAARDSVTWSKPPLEVMIAPKGAAPIRLIGVHAKSKAPHGARDDAEVTQLSIANRRKQLAQCIWLRKRVEQIINKGQPLVVMGDFNDGPGLDEYEELFGRSGVEIVLGTDGDPALALLDPHARLALSQRIGSQIATSRFFLKAQNRYLNALLDYIMVSRDIARTQPVWRIWHPFDDPGCWGNPALRDALLTASDHFPVTLDMPLNALK